MSWILRTARRLRSNPRMESLSTTSRAGTIETITDWNTKIVCTLGPASCERSVLEQMVQAGMDVVRLNFSHGSHSAMRSLFALVREVGAKYGERVAILCDIQGPKIRTGMIDEGFHLAQGATLKVCVDKPGFVGTRDMISIQYETMLNDLNTGDLIFINDGIVRLAVTGKKSEHLDCVVEAGGPISSHKGCNIPSGNISLEVVTEKDRADLALIAELDPEYVAASFIGTANDVQKVRDELAKHGNTDIKVVSKIERPIALENIDAIIEASDAVMVARGDLGVEIPAFEVPIAQKLIVRKCNRAGRPVIVATQMLESMTENSRPTRAEASDVFNAVLDGADAVMLSGETSVGKYPVQTIKYMDDIVAAAQAHLPARDISQYDSVNITMAEAMSHSVNTLAEEAQRAGQKSKIITTTRTGLVTRLVSKYRPCFPLVAVTPSLRVARELALVWGVHPIHHPDLKVGHIEAMWADAVLVAKAQGLLEEETTVVCVGGTEHHTYDSGNPIRIGLLSGIYKISELLKSLEAK